MPCKAEGTCRNLCIPVAKRFAKLVRRGAGENRKGVTAGSCRGKSSERGPKSNSLSYGSSTFTEQGVTSSHLVSSACFQAQDKDGWDGAAAPNTAVPHIPESPALGDISQGINGREGNCGRHSPGWGCLCLACRQGRAAPQDPWHAHVSSAGLKSSLTKPWRNTPPLRTPPRIPRVKGQQREPEVAAWAGVGNRVCTCAAKPSKISLLTWQCL